MSATMDAVVAASATASAVLGGAFFAFSSFVMPGLAKLSAADGIRAMQAVNEAAPRSLLMVPLLGSAAGSVAVGIHAVVSDDAPDRPLRMAGAALGVVAFAITVAANVPRNNALAALDPDSSASPTIWAGYLTEWTRWNHARTLAAASSAALLVWSWARSG